jgi:dUTPase
LFIRKLVEGGSEHSFGIHVAKMAGMPQLVIQKVERANFVEVSELPGSGRGAGGFGSTGVKSEG